MVTILSTGVSLGAYVLNSHSHPTSAADEYARLINSVRVSLSLLSAQTFALTLIHPSTARFQLAHPHLPRLADRGRAPAAHEAGARGEPRAGPARARAAQPLAAARRRRGAARARRAPGVRARLAPRQGRARALRARARRGLQGRARGVPRRHDCAAEAGAWGPAAACGVGGAHWLCVLASLSLLGRATSSRC